MAFRDNIAIANYFDVCKIPKGSTVRFKDISYLNELSRCATKSVMILRSFPSKVVRWTCILAFITYRPSLKEARGSQCIFRTRSSSWMDMAQPLYEPAVPNTETPKRRALEPAATKQRRHGTPLWTKQGENQRAPAAAPSKIWRGCYRSTTRAMGSPMDSSQLRVIFALGCHSLP